MPRVRCLARAIRDCGHALMGVDAITIGILAVVDAFRDGGAIILKNIDYAVMRSRFEGCSQVDLGDPIGRFPTP